jgi:lysophospholipase L1-like esterase
MTRDRLTRIGGLITALLLSSACGSGGSAGAARTADTPSGFATSGASSTVTPEASALPAASLSPAAPASAATFPAGALTIATLGDSLTEGTGDDSGGGGYPGRLQKLVEPLRPGTRVVNLGHSGWTSADLIDGQGGQPSELTQAIAAHPNVALVWIGSNDLWYLYEGGPEPMESSFEQADLATYEANIDTILRQLTSHGMTVFIALLDDQSKRPVVAHPNPTEPAFSEITPADLALMSAHVRAYNAIIGRKAAQYGAVTVDFYGTTIFTDAATLYGDGNHPNEAGYDKIAGIWFAALKPRL